MSYHITIKDAENPGMERIIYVPDRIAQEIRANNIKTATNFAKSIVDIYEKTEDPQIYYKVLNGLKFKMKFEEADKAMHEILKDFMLHGEYEPETTYLVKREVKEGDVCVDVGASIGYYTLLFGSLVGEKGEVYAFEPTTNQFAYLKENAGINGFQKRVRLFNAAAWDRSGIVQPKVNEGERGIMNGVILDDVLPKKVDFIKIDVDGAEPRVLKGLIRTIEQNPQLKMVIEYYPEYIKKAGNDPQEMLDILSKYFVYTPILGEFTDDYYNFYCVRK